MSAREILATFRCTYLQARIQLDRVHMARHSVRYIPLKSYTSVTVDSNRKYHLATRDEALRRWINFLSFGRIPSNIAQFTKSQA